jgi:probable HAF family extracellular repeat protein
METGGMQGLGVLGVQTSDFRFSGVSAVSADGSVIVGESTNSNGVTDWVEAFRWSTETGMQSVAEWLGPDVDLTGILLDTAEGVSANGAVVIGWMTRDGFNEAYLARVGGLTTPEDVSESFATLAAVTEQAGDAIGDFATRGRDCRTFGATGFCAFMDLRAGFGDDDTALTGTAGLAYRVGDRGRVGVATGFDWRTFDLGLGGDVDADGPMIAAFAGWGADDHSGLQLFGAGAYGHFDASIERGYVNGAGLASSEGDTTIDSTALYGRAAYGFPVAEEIVAGPFADITTAHSRQAGYSESGGPFPASFEARDETTLTTRLGVNANVQLSSATNVEMFAAWAARPTDDADPVSGEIDGALEATADAPAGTGNWLEAGARAVRRLTQTVAIHGGVSGRFGDDRPTPAVTASAGFEAGF